MNKELKYNGYSAQPSDYECLDGDLAVAINLVPEDGALKPVPPPKVSEQSMDIGNCVYIHKNAGYTHYIVRNSNSFSWYENNNPDQLTSIGTVSKYLKVTSVGNTLIFLTETGMLYYLWKGGNTGYLFLGSKIPECPISFGLQGTVVRTDEFQINFSNIHKNDLYNEFDDAHKSEITNAVLGRVNKFIADKATNNGKFIYPFLVRYAYRMYDGSLIMHSAPVLMIASSDLAPWATWHRLWGDDSNNACHANIRIMGVVHQLDYAVLNDTYIDNLKNWNDIIRSVDIFISKPIYTYNQNGYCTRFYNGFSDYEGYCVCKHINQASSTSTYPLRYQKNDMSKLWAHTFDPSGLTIPGGVLMLPKRSEDDIKGDIKSCSQFYLLESINVESLSSSRKFVPVEKDYLQSLVTREVMTDDYDSHDTLIPHYCFGYNNRLNLANIRKCLFEGFHGGAVFNYTDGFVRNFSDASPTAADGLASIMVYVYIKQDGKDIIIQSAAGIMAAYDGTPMLFFYYPNVNAYKAVFVRTDYFDMPHMIVDLEPHNFLNGAFYFGGWKNPKGISQSRPMVSSLAERTIDIANKIYTSEVNNPFYFPVLGINTIGTGEIKGICSAAKALSEGQFGQFPLYAFTTEGVWALEVSSTGTYIARQPITRDVCINPDGITQLDNAVLFPTDRGIMLISGSQTQCISEAINSEYPFNALDLPGFSKLHDMLGHNPASDKCLPTLPFTEFLKKCRMIYDYVHQRVIAYAPGITYAYVFSLKSKLWGMTFSNIASHLNSYPEALAVDNENNIVNFSESDETQVKCLFVTRPLNLDTVNVHKTIDSVIQRGFFRKGNVKTALYGSRDLVNWHLVWSSKDHFLRGFRGTPYKYFRIAGVTTLGADESIFGASVQFTPRLTNQPR